MLKAAGRLVPQLGIVAFQRELAAHHAQQVGDQAQLVGKRGVQQKVCRGLEALDIPGLTVQHSIPHGKGLFRAAAAGGGIPQGAAAQTDILGVDHPAAVDAVFLPQAGIDAVDVIPLHKAGELRVQGMDALHQAHAPLQVDGFCFIRALLGREVVDGQGGLAGLAQLPQALLDERQVQRIGVLIVQGAVRQAGVELRPLEEIVQTDDLRRGALLLQGAGDAVGAGGLAAGRRAGEHDDLCAGHADLLGGIIHPLGIAVLAQLCQLLRAPGSKVI